MALIDLYTMIRYPSGVLVQVTNDLSWYKQHVCRTWLVLIDAIGQNMKAPVGRSRHKGSKWYTSDLKRI